MFQTKKDLAGQLTLGSREHHFCSQIVQQWSILKNEFHGQKVQDQEKIHTSASFCALCGFREPFEKQHKHVAVIDPNMRWNIDLLLVTKCNTE